MDLDIAGKRALVTGGSLGIGRATAAALVAEGVDVAIVARDAERLDRVARELTANGGGRAVAVAGDMSKADEVEAAVAAARAALGGIDILINNAGSAPAGAISDLDDETWYSAFDLKFMGYVRCARAVIGEMRARRWGRIVNIVGMGGRSPSAGYILGGSYNAALFNFTKALAKDCGADNVLVNAINPGATDTPRWQYLVERNSALGGRTAEQIVAKTVADIPLGKIGKPDDIADLAVFLCSERANHIAGAIVDVDGGGARGL